MTTWWTNVATVRADLANAIADQVTDTYGFTVTPYPTKPAPPHIYLEPDSPFFERKANGIYVWAYTAVIVVTGGHKHAWDWFEVLGPLLDDAAHNVTGGMFHTMDAPADNVEGSDGRLIIAEAHITIKRNKE